MRTQDLMRLSLTLLSAAAFTACDSQSTPEPERLVDRVGLSPFASCDDVLEFAHAKGLEQVGPYGFEDEGYWGWEEDFGEGTSGGGEGGDAPAGGDSAGDGGGGDGAEDHSGTNVQELGVDEPDLVKTDGERILALSQGRLHYIDLSSGSAVLTGAVDLFTQINDYEWYGGNEMLVHGDRVLVIAPRYVWDVDAAILEALSDGKEQSGVLTQLIEVDVSNPAAPVVRGNFYIAGGYVSGRQIETAARLVLRSSPSAFAFKYPWDFMSESDYNYDPYGGTWNEAAYQQAEKLAEQHNRALIEASTLEQWLPRFIEVDAQGNITKSGQLVPCERVFEPSAFAGLGVLSVLTVDMASDIAFGDAMGIFSEGETVYASKQNLYVATWPQHLASGDDVEAKQEIVSYIHKFDITSPAKAEYRASGEVPGHLLSQWAMSEHEGDLRVASTDWGWWSEGSQSYVSVLREQAGELEVVGQVGGIGPDEQIFGVRFMGKVGYVVTFRQTDPLFTIDLADPTAPQVVGELHMPGYSAYLHPMSEGILLGVGRDGDETGALGGASLNIFDVSDPANPLRLHAAAFGEGWASSSVEWDHRAFLYWAPERLVVIPVTSWEEDVDSFSYFTGAVAYRVDAEMGITLAGVIENEPLYRDNWGWSYGGEILRSLAIGDELYTVSESGLRISSMSNLAASGWVAF